MIEIEVKEGLLPWAVGMGTILIGIFLAWDAAAHPNDSARVMFGVCLVIVLMMGGGVLLCMDAKNRKMTVENEHLCYTNCLGKKKNFTLTDIGCCKAVLENKSSKEDICLYDRQGKKLCKLNFNMKGSLQFLQYLIDNQIEVECSPKSDRYLRAIIDEKPIDIEEIPDKVNHVYGEMKMLVNQWEMQHKAFDAEWKMGIAAYLQNELSETKRLWEEKSFPLENVWKSSLPEDCIIGVEGYLQKEKQFVCDRKNQTVMFYVPLISVRKSWRIGEELKIHFWGDGALEELAGQMEAFSEQLPKKRYHTEEIVLQHELKEGI